MAVLPTPGPAGSPPPAPPLPDRLALPAPVSPARLGPSGGKAAHVAAPRAPCRGLSAGRPLARHARRLCGMPGQTAAGTPLRQAVHHPAGGGFPGAADAASIRTTPEQALARPPGLPVLDHPCGQASIQADLRHPGRAHAAGRCPLLRGTQGSRRADACRAPRAAPAPSAPRTAPLREQRAQLPPGQVVDQSTDSGLHAPRHGPRPTLRTQRVQRLGLPGPLAEAMGAPRQRRLDESLPHQAPRALAPLVLEAGVASRPRRPIVLLAPYPFDGRRHRPLSAPPRVPVSEVVGPVPCCDGAVERLPARTPGPARAPRGCPPSPESAWPVGPGSGVAWRRWVRPASLPEGLPETARPGVAFPPGGPWDSGSPPSRPGAPSARPAVRGSATTAQRPSRGRAVLPRLPRDLGAHLGLWGPGVRQARGRGGRRLATPAVCTATGGPPPPARPQGAPGRAPGPASPWCKPAPLAAPGGAWTRAVAPPGLWPSGHGTPSAFPSLPREEDPVDHALTSGGAPSRGRRPRSLQRRTPMTGGARGVHA
jgi:hypothetical protein